MNRQSVLVGTLLDGGVEQLAARQDHSLKVTSSSLVSATRNSIHKINCMEGYVIMKDLSEVVNETGEYIIPVHWEVYSTVVV